MSVPKIHRWNSILGKDAFQNVEKLKQTPRPPLAKNISFLSDGSLKDLASIKKSIDEESDKFFLNLKSIQKENPPQSYSDSKRTVPARVQPQRTYTEQKHVRTNK